MDFMFVSFAPGAKLVWDETHSMGPKPRKEKRNSMGVMNKLVFKGDDGKTYIELHDDSTYVQYAFNDVEEVFDTLSVMAKCMAADMEGKGIVFDPGYEIVCEGACEGMMAKFSEPQMRAIFKVLYEKDLPSDLDVLAQELQMRMR